VAGSFFAPALENGADGDRRTTSQLSAKADPLSLEEGKEGTLRGQNGYLFTLALQLLPTTDGCDEVPVDLFAKSHFDQSADFHHRARLVQGCLQGRQLREGGLQLPRLLGLPGGEVGGLQPLRIPLRFCARLLVRRIIGRLQRSRTTARQPRFEFCLEILQESLLLHGGWSDVSSSRVKGLFQVRGHTSWARLQIPAFLSCFRQAGGQYFA